MSRSTSAGFTKKFLFWYRRLDAPKQREKSEEFFNILKEISQKLNNLSNRGQNNEHLIYIFKCKEDIKLFIEYDLQLGKEYVKWWWVLKGILLAHKEFSWQKTIKKNRNVSMFIYFRTLIYHLYFWKGQVDSGRCLPIVTNYLE